MSAVVTWPMPLTEMPFPLYTLSVDGVSVPVWSGRVRETINKPAGAGWTQMLNGPTAWCGFARFDFDGTVEVAVTVDRDFSSVAILPEAFGIEPTVDGRVISFQMREPLPLTILLDGGDEEALHLFTHRPEHDVPSPTDPDVIYFGPGEHWVDTIDVANGQTVYLDGGAIVRASLPAGATGKQGGVLNLFSYPGPVINVAGVEDVRICGRGIIDGTLLPHPAKNLILLDQSKHVRVEGITLRNSPNWHMPINQCEDIEVDGLCCLSGRLNSDGINCVSSSRVRVRNCFVRSHDDSFAVKATSPDRGSADILYERCVAWNDWGYAFGVTYETRSPIHDVTYRDCHAVYARHWFIGIHAADGGGVSNINFEQMSVCYPRTRIALEMGRALIKIDNCKDVWATDDGISQVHGIVLSDIAVKGADIPGISVNGNDADHPIKDVRLHAIRLNGELLQAGTPMVQVNEHTCGVTVTAET